MRQHRLRCRQSPSWTSGCSEIGDSVQARSVGVHHEEVPVEEGEPAAIGGPGRSVELGFVAVTPVDDPCASSASCLSYEDAATYRECDPLAIRGPGGIARRAVFADLQPPPSLDAGDVQPAPVAGKDDLAPVGGPGRMEDLRVTGVDAAPSGAVGANDVEPRLVQTPFGEGDPAPVVRPGRLVPFLDEFSPTAVPDTNNRDPVAVVNC